MVRLILTLLALGSMRRRPGQQRPYNSFALPARKVGCGYLYGGPERVTGPRRRCSAAVSLSRGRLRQPGCDRDEYLSAALAGRGESTDAVTWNVARNEPWVDDVRAIVHPLGGLHRRRVVDGEPSSKGMSPSSSLAPVILRPARKLSGAPSSGGPRQVQLIERGDIVRSRSAGD